jgi:hypothetical protein
MPDFMFYINVGYITSHRRSRHVDPVEREAAAEKKGIWISQILITIYSALCTKQSIHLCLIVMISVVSN